MAYMETLLKQLGDTDLSKGGLFKCEVRHEAWCNLLSGDGECNCQAEIKIARTDTPEGLQ